MNKSIFTIAIILLCVSGIVAQNNSIITGSLKEKTTGTPIEFAAVGLYDTSSEIQLSGCMTDSVGKFVFKDVSPGTYYIQANYVGYTPVKSSDFSLDERNSIDIGTLFLSESLQLSEVIIEKRKSTLTTKLDKKIFNVGQDLMSSSGSISDILQNIPAVDVDMDGQVSLRGNDNVTILIDGKPSAIMNNRNRGEALNQLSAGNIERIEIITNPSAEYKPDGTSGIINIVLKKDAHGGLNGTVNANVGSYNRANAGLNINYRIKGINLFGSYSFRRDRYDRTIDDHRISETDTIKQTTYGLGRPVSHSFRLGMATSLGRNDRFELSGAYNHRRFKRNEQVESETINSLGHMTDSYKRDREAFAKENMWEGNLQYSHSYGDENEFGVDYNYSSESEDEINHYTTLHDDNLSKNDETVWDASYLHTAKLFWHHRINTNMKITGGYELEYLRAEQNYHVFDLLGDEFIPDPDRTNDFTHHRFLNSLYTTAEMHFHQWNLLAGLRGEYADICNDLHSRTKDLYQHYFNVYPTIHISHPVGSESEAMLSYSLRVNRPEGRDMNPFAERINPLSLEAGNPNLKPEKIHSLEGGYIWRNGNGSSLMGTIYYRHILNQITEVSRYIEDGVLLTTKENLQSSQNAGVELIYNMPVRNWFDFNLNLNGYYNRIDASKLGFSKQKDTFSWSAVLNANFIPFKHYMVQLNTRYRSATLVPQGKRDSDIRINIGMKYDIPRINLSIIGSVTDLLDTYRKSYTLDTPQLKQKVEKRRNPRIFYIGVSWQFGAGKKHPENSLEYDEGL